MIGGISELEFIFMIVLGNLEPYKYTDLLPEAQEAMLREAETLMNCPELTEGKKRQLSDAMGLLSTTLEVAKQESTTNQHSLGGRR